MSYHLQPFANVGLNASLLEHLIARQDGTRLRRLWDYYRNPELLGTADMGRRRGPRRWAQECGLPSRLTGVRDAALDDRTEKRREVVIENDIGWRIQAMVDFMFGKPVRITSLQSVTGGVFNNADILRVDYATEYNAEAMEEDKDGYLLSLKALTGAVAYDRLKMWVDKKSVLPTKIECYAASGLLIKTLYFKDTRDFGGGIRRPATVETDSPLYKGYKSVMLYSQLKKRDLADEVFTLNYLPRVADLRK